MAEAIRSKTSIQNPKRLALRELEPLAGALLTVLLALLDTRITGQQAVSLQCLAELDVELEQCTCNSKLHSISLCRNAATANRGQYVELTCKACRHQGATR